MKQANRQSIIGSVAELKIAELIKRTHVEPLETTLENSALSEHTFMIVAIVYLLSSPVCSQRGRDCDRDSSEPAGGSSGFGAPALLSPINLIKRRRRAE